MTCDVRWLASASTSAFHAAAAMDRGAKLAHDRLAHVLSDPLGGIQRHMSAAGLSREAFWRHVVPLSATIDSNRQLAEVVLRKIADPSRQSGRSVEVLAELFTSLERAIQGEYPDLVDELALRAKPLREQWEAVGPGLLTLIGKKTDESLIVPAADVILVQPALGGAGQTHLYYNSVHIEAVLANPHDDLPETLRLAWMISQLNNDLPVHSESIHGDCLLLISNLALLPATLQAGGQLNLARYDAPTVQRAIQAWHIDGPQDVQLGPIVELWWETFCASRSSWNVALGALSRMIGEQLAAMGR